MEIDTEDFTIKQNKRTKQINDLMVMLIWVVLFSIALS